MMATSIQIQVFVNMSFEGKLDKRVGYAKLELSSKEFEKFDEFTLKSK